MDQIADLLTRIKNCSSVNKKSLKVSYSKTKEAILSIFQKEGFVASVEVETVDNKKFLSIVLSETKKTSHLQQVSKSGLRVYSKSKEIPKPLHGLGTVVVSTSSGIITGREAIKKGLGGEIICEIW